jgi:hypothetical protein
VEQQDRQDRDTAHAIQAGKTLKPHQASGARAAGAAQARRATSVPDNTIGDMPLRDRMVSTAGILILNNSPRKRTHVLT